MRHYDRVLAGVGLTLCLPIFGLSFLAPRLSRHWSDPLGTLAGMLAAACAVYLLIPFFESHYGKLFLVGLALIAIAFVLFKGF